MDNNKVLLIVKTSCASSRKAKAYFDANNIAYDLFMLGREELTLDLLREILYRSDEGTQDILMRGKFKIASEDMSVREVEECVLENPKLLKTPIMIKDSKFLVGFHEENITTFMPKEQRRRLLNRYIAQLA